MTALIVVIFLQGTTTVSSVAILFLLARPLTLPGRAHLALNCLLGVAVGQVRKLQKWYITLDTKNPEKGDPHVACVADVVLPRLVTSVKQRKDHCSVTPTDLDLRALRARASHARRACEARAKKSFLASLPSLALWCQPHSRPFVWLLARTWIRKNKDCFTVYNGLNELPEMRLSNRQWLF